MARCHVTTTSNLVLVYHWLAPPQVSPPGAGGAGADWAAQSLDSAAQSSVTWNPGAAAGAAIAVGCRAGTAGAGTAATGALSAAQPVTPSSPPQFSSFCGAANSGLLVAACAASWRSFSSLSASSGSR